MSSDKAKEAAGHVAAELIREGMTVGIGTGSTAAFFIDRLAQRCREGLKIKAVATSQKSLEKATSLGINMIDVQECLHIDMTVDGADEIDSQKRMIKGGGGALLREKIIASMSTEMVVIIDSSKQVDFLGRMPLPVEIIPFAYKSTIDKITRMGYQGKIRKKSNDEIYITDNQNYIFDLTLTYPCKQPEKEHARIREIPGVVDTGFFFNLAGRVVVGYPDGRCEIHN